MILQVLDAVVAGCAQRHQQQVIACLSEENRVLKSQPSHRRLRLTDRERRRLATLAHPLSRKRLQEVATLATPAVLLRWYHDLIAQKFDGSKPCTPRGRPRPEEKVEDKVIKRFYLSLHKYFLSGMLVRTVLFFVVCTLVKLVFGNDPVTYQGVLDLLGKCSAFEMGTGEPPQDFR
jgi:hypothetical protein